MIIYENHEKDKETGTVFYTKIYTNPIRYKKEHLMMDWYGRSCKADKPIQHKFNKFRAY